ncbi:UDP-glucose 4-epimerase [Bacillus canaveralius]|uniref:UDP-glucose 4-epimerase n=1 Tax=Bacillus canaveralius TaxID=1403243 RepID=A0A2N5GFU2_9BACI|nr:MULTISPECIES: NAD-dependent epimerase/dehydratase family protein [Bacillus]PLR79603.1 UDP-glucose 4-epimerase [Bacillus canaveralius]PLR83077.1 UDP-glucose 4-epimerase [Bacillus sp. V33-4]PLR90089.1 UDP-glucose 4-epimerase [Bacillus canaveralius]RSK52506.1 NAD-dependent epimerase/dehydratase family protein [Bacillus canaveralius]
MKVLVTGGAGFIGSHLAQRLINEQHEVTIVDNLHSYYSPERKKQHLRNIQNAGDFKFHHVDLLNSEETLTIFQLISPEAVIHLAALPGVAYSIMNPLKYVDYDIKATINVLEASGKSNISQFIFASSSSVYGNVHEMPCHEEMAKGNVISPYAASKYSAEAFCRVYEHLYGFPVKILRFFTVYGPWGRPDMAISSFIKKLLKSEHISVYGNGSARDYTYIDDIITGIYYALTRLDSSEVLNIGSGRPVSMDTLINELKTYFPNMKVKREVWRKGDVHSTWADITKAGIHLGYQPSVDFQTGIARTIEWAKQYESFL